MGFTERYHGAEWKVFATEDALPAAAAEVDRIAAVVEAAGGREMSAPKRMPYGPDYYAVYFCDPSGNRFEVYHRLAG